MSKIESYIIIFLDLVDYSLKPEPDQMKLFAEMQRGIYHVLYHEITSEECILIPTGDGMIIGLKNLGEVSFKNSLRIVVDITEWAQNNNCCFRTVLHVGVLNVVKDINKNRNMIGNLLNDASRMLAGGEAKSIVVSKEYFDSFLGKKHLQIGIEQKIDDNYSFTILDEGSIADKHGCIHNILITTLTNGDKVFGAETRITSNFYTRIYADDYPKKENLKESFSEKLRNCSDVVFYGIYHKTLPDILSNIIINNYKNINITAIYAADILEQRIENYFVNYDQSLIDKKQSIESLIKFRENHKFKDNIVLRILEYDKMPSFGASFVDVDQQGCGFMHISNYIRGIVPDKTPYFELEWKFSKQQSLYKFYADYYREKIKPFLKEVKV
jgi:hypothetical protein